MDIHTIGGLLPVAEKHGFKTSTFAGFGITEAYFTYRNLLIAKYSSRSGLQFITKIGLNKRSFWSKSARYLCIQDATRPIDPDQIIQWYVSSVFGHESIQSCTRGKRAPFMTADLDGSEESKAKFGEWLDRVKAYIDRELDPDPSHVNGWNLYQRALQYNRHRFKTLSGKHAVERIHFDEILEKLDGAVYTSVVMCNGGVAHVVKCSDDGRGHVTLLVRTVEKRDSVFIIMKLYSGRINDMEEIPSCIISTVAKYADIMSGLANG